MRTVVAATRLPSPLRGGVGGGVASAPPLYLRRNPSPKPSPRKGERALTSRRGFRETFCMNDQGRPTRAEPIAAERKTFTGNRGLAIEEALLFEIGRNEVTGVDVDMPATKGDRLGKASPQGADRSAGTLRARRDAPLRAAQPEELRHRPRHLSARLVHDEAQPAAQRAGGAADRLCRHPPAAAGLLGARRAGADPRARPLAHRDHRHAFGRDDAEGRRAWRALRHDGDQGGARRARRDAHQGAGAGLRARHQPGDGGAARLFGRAGAGARRTARCISTR